MESATDPDPSEEIASSVAIISDATCLACGCLCDDIRIVVDEGRIVEARNACAIGRDWFLADHAQEAIPLATMNGREVGRDEAVQCAAAILSEAKAPVVLGLSWQANETVAAALAVADRVGATVEIGRGSEAATRLGAYQRVGKVSATLGEVKDRADVVVFWGADPVTSHPRHLARYSLEPAGRFIPEGRAGRTLIVVDGTRNSTAERADVFLAIAPERWCEAFAVLRALIGGKTIDGSVAERATELSAGILTELAGRIRAARYGALFYDRALLQAGEATIESAHRLIRDLNASTRFIMLPLGGPGNGSGAESVLTWQSGFANGVDFSGTSPSSLMPDTLAGRRLESGGADAALLVGETATEFLSAAARSHLDRIPRVVIAPKATERDGSATVALASATTGIDGGGTVSRCDGVVLPLRPPLAASVPTDRAWLLAIAEQLDSLQEARTA